MLRKIIHGIVFLLCCISLNTAFATDRAPPTTAAKVDITRYLGTWYEIASFPMFFQRNCVCTRARYALKQGKFQVINSCNKKTADGKEKVVNASGEIVPNSNNSKLKVQFFWPIHSDYWILYVNQDYTLALVGTSNYKYLWMLSRTPQISDQQYQQLEAIAKQKGYDTSDFQRTQQTGCKY